jgi:hypothetical protein
MDLEVAREDMKRRDALKR